MENPTHFEAREELSLPQSLPISRFVRATSLAIALALSGIGCSKDPCENIPNGIPGQLPVPEESVCFLKGDLYDQERAQAFRQACASQGRVPKRWWIKYAFGEPQNAHICLLPKTTAAWIPEADEGFSYDGRNLRQ